MGLSVTDLSVARGGITVLEGVSFRLEQGGALVLRGANGIGKTTLLRTVAGLQPAVAGSIAGGAEIAYAGHADGLKSALTVSENLSFWAAVYGTKLTPEILNSMQLADLAARPAGQLSAGQKRRLGLARLLVAGRSVWVLDEPTVSLDTVSVRLFDDVLRTHLKCGGSALIASHLEMGLGETLDLAPYRARATAGTGVFDASFGGDIA